MTVQNRLDFEQRAAADRAALETQAKEGFAIVAASIQRLRSRKD